MPWEHELLGDLQWSWRKCGRVFGWRRIDRRPALQTGLDWDVRGPRLVRGRPWWRHSWSCRMGQGNCEGKTRQFWRYVWRGSAEFRRGEHGFDSLSANSWNSSICYHCALVTVSPALPPCLQHVHAQPPPKGQRLRTPLRLHIWEVKF